MHRSHQVQSLIAGVSLVHFSPLFLPLHLLLLFENDTTTIGSAIRCNLLIARLSAPLLGAAFPVHNAEFKVRSLHHTYSLE